jgi:GNAT superfamily N-acetyltransferase
LAVARSDQVESIYRESHALWGGGLSFPDYVAFWNELSATAWAVRNLTHYVWLDERERVLSSAKVYRPRARLLGRERRACIIGAVFTPVAHRGQGHASALMQAVLDRARDDGDGPAILFSDIGTSYYASLGFRELPAEETWGRVPRVREQDLDGWSMREIRARDFERVREFHDGWCRSRPLAILRDEDHWDFLMVRVNRFFDRLRDTRLVPRYRVALHHGEVLGYLFSVEGQGEWSLRELGARDGDPELMAQVLRSALPEARAAGLRRFYGWLERDVTERLPEWKVRRRSRRRAIPMLRPLDDDTDVGKLGAPDAAFLPYQDQF